MGRWLSLAAAGALLVFGQQVDPGIRDGLLALNAGQLEEARQHLEQAAQRQPADPRLWLGLAQTYTKLKRETEASGAAAKAEALVGKNKVLPDAAVLHGLAVYASEAGKLSAAAGYAARSLGIKEMRLRPDEGFYGTLAERLLRGAEFPAAITLLEATRVAFPNHRQFELMYGVACYGARRFPESVDSFLRVIALDPALPQPYGFLGRMSQHTAHRKGEVERAFLAYAEANPNGAQAQLLAGKIAGDEARLRKALALDGTLVEAHLELGLLLEGKRQFAEAAASVSEAVRLNPGHPSAWYRLARLWDRLKEPEKAAAARARHAEIQKAQLATMDKHAF